MNVVLRPYDKALDYGFIISTWPKAVYYGTLSGMPQEAGAHYTWFAEKFKEINSRLERWTVRMAVDPEDPSFVLGYSVTYRSPVDDYRRILFVYVKKGYRCQGIGRLLEGPEKLCDYDTADWTDLGKAIVEKRKRKEDYAKSNSSDVSSASNDSHGDS